MKPGKFQIITVKVDIHPDGDVYVHDEKGICRIIGQLSEPEAIDIRGIPDKCYKKAKRLGKLL